MISIIANSLKTGVLTEANPFEMRPSFGFPVIDFTRCTGCEECARVCPTGAIQAGSPAAGQKTISLSYASCIQCQACVTGCPEKAVSVSHDLTVAAYSREQLTQTGSFAVDAVTGRSTFAR